MSLGKAMLWSVAQSAVKFAVGFVGIKVTAVYLGPSGMALVGQFNNFLSMSTNATIGGVQTGLAKMTAQAGPDDHARHAAVWPTALRVGGALALVTALLMALSCYWLSARLLLDQRYWPVFLLGSVALLAAALNGILNGILNGMKRMHALALGIIASSLLSLLLTVPMVYTFGVWGGLVGGALVLVLTAAVSAYFLRREVAGAWATMRHGYDRGVARELFKFYPMVLANAFSSQFTLIAVRSLIAAGMGTAAAGIWQASTRISDMYTAIIVSALSLYLMPHLSSIKEARAFRREIFGVSLKVAGATALIAVVLYLLRDLVILLLFTRQFQPMRDLFQYQLVGDVLMVACWPLRMGLTVKLKVRQYLAVESMNALAFIGGTWLLLPRLGLAGAPVAYLSGYLLSLLALMFLYRRA
jgi:PST family polysaccharide transporter